MTADGTCEVVEQAWLFGNDKLFCRLILYCHSAAAAAAAALCFTGTLAAAATARCRTPSAPGMAVQQSSWVRGAATSHHHDSP
jgi:hypothetical protein